MNYIESMVDISDSELLSKQSVQSLTGISHNIKQRFEASQRFRSRYEMENSVLNDVKFPTPDSKYWQSVREQMVHFEELVILSFEYRKSQARLELLNCKRAKLEVDMESAPPDSIIQKEFHARISMLDADIGKLEFTLACQKKMANERHREITSWEEIMNNLIPNMKYGVDSPEEHQPESYYLRYKAETQMLPLAKGAGPADVRNVLSQFGMAAKRARKNEHLECKEKDLATD